MVLARYPIRVRKVSVSQDRLFLFRLFHRWNAKYRNGLVPYRTRSIPNLRPRYRCRRCFWKFIDLENECSHAWPIAVKSKFLFFERRKERHRRVIGPSAKFRFQITDSQNRHWLRHLNDPCFAPKKRTLDCVSLTLRGIRISAFLAAHASVVQRARLVSIQILRHSSCFGWQQVQRHDCETDRRAADTPSLKLATTTRRLISPLLKAFKNFS
jgi:hypothetical protein